MGTFTYPRYALPLLGVVTGALSPRDPAQRRLCIINYHRILERPDPLLSSEPDVATFRWQMQLLAKSFNVLPLSEAVTLMRARRLPPRAIAITFDDGYRSMHDLALPVLREFELPATVFVTTGCLDQTGSMWNDVILDALRNAPAGPLDLGDAGQYVLGTHQSRHEAADAITLRCKYLSPEGRAELLGRLVRHTGQPGPTDLMLTRDMLRTLAASNVEIGGHTVTHPILTVIDDATARREIVDNKHQLEDIIGRPVDLFAYPNGKVGIDFDARHVEMVRAAGFQAAFTTAPGSACSRDDLFMLPRARPWDRNPYLFAGRLASWSLDRSAA